MQDNTSSATEARRTGGFLVAAGVAAIVALLLAVALFLFLTLPDAGAFDARVERMFIENADLTGRAEIKLLEILAQSGTAFSDTLASYRIVIFVLLVFATAMMIAALVFSTKARSGASAHRKICTGSAVAGSRMEFGTSTMKATMPIIRRGAVSPSARAMPTIAPVNIPGRASGAT